MLKTISAALVAASLMFAPGLAASADAAQGATRPAATKTVKVVKTGKRHVVKHHRRHKHVKNVRHVKTYAIKRHAKIVRHGKIVKAHKHSHVVTTKPRVRAN
jgi:hypothetical protein